MVDETVVCLLEEKIEQLKNDLKVADTINGRLIRKLNDIHELVTGTLDDDEVRYRVLEVVETEDEQRQTDQCEVDS